MAFNKREMNTCFACWQPPILRNVCAFFSGPVPSCSDFMSSPAFLSTGSRRTPFSPCWPHQTLRSEPPWTSFTSPRFVVKNHLHHHRHHHHHRRHHHHHDHHHQHRRRHHHHHHNPIIIIIVPVVTIIFFAIIVVITTTTLPLSSSISLYYHSHHCHQWSLSSLPLSSSVTSAYYCSTTSSMTMT